VNSFTLHDDLSGKDIQLAWSDICTLIINAENPSEFVNQKDKKQLQQIATQFRSFLD